MQVDNPKFDSTAEPGTVQCKECPFTNEHGNMERDELVPLCDGWGDSHNSPCPTAETYAEACKMAEKARTT